MAPPSFPAAAPGSARTRRLAVRAALVLGTAVATAALVLALRPGDGAGRAPGPTVEVEVVDPAGRPVRGAEVQARYAPGWRPVGADGRLVLEGVPLRAGEAADPGAVALALEARAPSHAVRAGRPPAVLALPGPGAGGRFSARFVLEPCGVLRLRLEPTSLPGAQAVLTAEGADRGALEPVSGVAVARPGQPAAWRVFDPEARLLVWTTGFEGVATRRREVEAPGPGFTRDLAVAIEPSRPVHGRVALGSDPAEAPPPAPPTFEGRLHVAELLADGTPVPLPDVRVEADGTFVVPYAGDARYHLRADLPFAEVPPATVRGGDDVTLDGATPRAWLAVAGVPDDGAALRVDLGRTDPGVPPARQPPEILHRGTGTLCVALVEGPGAYRGTVLLDGTAAGPPRRARFEVEVPGPGPTPVTAEFAALPAGAVVVEFPGGEAAEVSVLEPFPRTATVLPPAAPRARFANLPAGPFAAVVRFQDPALAEARLTGEVPEGGTLVLQVRAGGTAVIPPEAAPPTTGEVRR